LHGTSQMVGVTIGGWYGGYLTELLDWRWMLLLLAGVGMIYGPGLRFLISDGDPVGHERSTETYGPPRVSLLRVILSPSYLTLCLVFFALCGMIWINYTWLADFLRSKFGLPLSTAGWIATAYTQLATLPGLLVGALWGDRWGRSSRRGRLWLVLLGMGISSPLFYLLAASESLKAVKLAGLGYGLFQGVFNANFIAALVTLLPSYHRGIGVGLCNMVGSVSGGLFAYLLGHLKELQAPESLFGVVAVMGVLSSLVLAFTLVIFFDRDYRVCHESD
jgi:predicted MFS family arabinose efflux permease